MKTEKFDEKLFDQCISNHLQESTIQKHQDSLEKSCPICKTPFLCMRLVKSPNIGSGFISDSDILWFHGCPDCMNVHYVEDDLIRFAGKKM